MLVAEYMFWSICYGVEYDLCKMWIKSAEEETDFCGSQIKRKYFLKCYKMFPPIETLPENEKKELKDFVIRSFPGKGKDELVENCKIIYTAGMMCK